MDRCKNLSNGDSMSDAVRNVHELLRQAERDSLDFCFIIAERTPEWELNATGRASELSSLYMAIHILDHLQDQGHSELSYIVELLIQMAEASEAYTESCN